MPIVSITPPAILPVSFSDVALDERNAVEKSSMFMGVEFRKWRMES